MQTDDSDGDFSNAEEDIRITDTNIRATEANIPVTDNNIRGTEANIRVSDDHIRMTDGDGEYMGARDTDNTVEKDKDQDSKNGVNTCRIDDNIKNNNNKYNKSISSSIRTNTKTVNNNSIQRPLTFGIDSILKVRVNSIKERTISENGACHDTVNEHVSGQTNVLDYSGEQVGASHTSDDDGDENDDEQDSAELRLKSAAFEAEAVRARIALLRYSTTAFSAFNTGNGSGGRPGCIQQTVFPPSFSLTNTGSGGYAWPSVSANAGDVGRKDRYEFVRRVGHPYQNRTPPKRKKPRTSFTRLQILELEKRFERQKYLASTERSALAKSLKMSDGQVKTWFQNRRTKWRRQTAEEREIERQAANRLLLSLQAETNHRKSVGLPSDPVCLSHFQRWQDQRSADV